MTTRMKRAGRHPAVPPPVQPNGQCRLRYPHEVSDDKEMPHHGDAQAQHERSWPHSRWRTDYRSERGNAASLAALKRPLRRYRRAAACQGICGGHEH